MFFNFYRHRFLLIGFFFFFKQKTAYDIRLSLVGSEMCIRDRCTRAPRPPCGSIGAVQAHDAYLEAELASAERRLTSDLYHYTSADGALFGILHSGNLRLSPFEFTNDLWESRPLYPHLTSHFDDQSASPESSFALWKEIDRNIRLHSKVACLTQDWDLPDHVLNSDALRGWAHLSLWAHYGEGHAGVCLRFARDKLIRAF